MFERWRQWRYERLSNKIARSDDFQKFVEWESGPWTMEVARKIPFAQLLAGPPMGQIDAQTRRVIDIEIARRTLPRSPIIANLISLLALIVAFAALFKAD